MNHLYINISIRIIIIFISAMLYSFVPDFLHEFFDDTYCKNGSGLWVFSTNNVSGHYQFCNYSTSHEADTWHWGYRHWLFMCMGICLSVVQVLSLIFYIEKKIKMNITTKFNVQQKVWRLKNNKAIEGEVQSIEVNAYSNESPIIEYWIDRVNIDGNRYKEKDLFASREELIASL
jgi:hypothetical protein